MARRISIGPWEVAGYFSRLKQGFDAIGVDSEHFVLSANAFSYPESPYYLRDRYLGARAIAARGGALYRAIGRVLEAWIRLRVFAHAVRTCDAFIYSGFGGFLGFLELWLLKRLGKRTIVVYLGSDARPPLFSGRHLDDDDGALDPRRALGEIRRLVRRVRRVERYADVIVNHTATAQLFQRDFARLLAVGVPVPELPTAPSRACGSLPCRIVHAPSRPLAKGSPELRGLIDELCAEGVAIEFVELRGVPNHEVLSQLSRCDFVVDEMYSDTPMATLAAEAAQLGKPTVVGGYYAANLAEDNASSPLPPALYVEPSKLKEAIRRLATDPALRATLGAEAQAFVRSAWSAPETARRFLRLIEESEIPAAWSATPSRLSYVLGWGLSKERWRTQVGGFLDRFGAGALGLDHDPALRARVVAETRGPAEAEA